MKEEQSNEEKSKISIKEYVKLIIAIILLILCIITSFKTGQKYYELVNSGFNDSTAHIQSDMAKFKFSARIVY